MTSHKAQTDVDAINKRLDAAEDRARTQQEQEAQRLKEEREERLSLVTAQVRSQLLLTYGQVDVTDTESYNRGMDRIEQCLRVLSGGSPAPASTPVVAPVATSPSLGDDSSASAPDSQPAPTSTPAAPVPPTAIPEPEPVTEGDDTTSEPEAPANKPHGWIDKIKSWGKIFD